MRALLAQLTSRARSVEPPSWTIKCTFTVAGFRLPQIDLTPLLGIALIATVALLLAANTWRGG